MELQESIGKVIKVHEENLNLKMKNDKIKAVSDILHIHRDMNKVINPDIIRETFIETGMYTRQPVSMTLRRLYQSIM